MLNNGFDFLFSTIPDSGIVFFCSFSNGLSLRNSVRLNVLAISLPH